MSIHRRTPGHKYLLESPFPVWKKRSFVFDRAKEGHKMNCLLWAMFQNGRFVGDADLDRQKFSDLKLNGPQVILWV